MSERLFVAVPLAPPVREAIAAGLPASLPGRRTASAGWHLTLRFLGDTEPARRDALIAALEAVRAPAFALTLGGFGAFPRAERARVLWLGVREGAAPLLALQRRIEAAARAVGFPAERTPYTPHLTLARLQPPSSVAAWLARAPTVTVPAAVDAFVLLRSHLGAGPPRYERLRTVPLG